MIDAVLTVVSIQPVGAQISRIAVIADVGASAFRQILPFRVESLSKRDVARLSWIAFRTNGLNSLHSSPSQRFIVDWIEILRIGGEFVRDDAIREQRDYPPDAPLQRLPEYLLWPEATAAACVAHLHQCPRTDSSQIQAGRLFPMPA